MLNAFKRVPIYSAASWASLISLRVAFYVDPLRDVYEVRQTCIDFLPGLPKKGFYDLYFLSASNQLPWRGALADHHD